MRRLVALSKFNMVVHSAKSVEVGKIVLTVIYNRIRREAKTIWVRSGREGLIKLQRIS
jgi:hypothetical protein